MVDGHVVVFNGLPCPAVAGLRQANQDFLYFLSSFCLHEIKISQQSTIIFPLEMLNYRLQKFFSNYAACASAVENVPCALE